MSLVKILRWIGIGLGILIGLPSLFLIEENMRGRFLLHRYLNELRARSEKLTVAELAPPPPPTEGNGAPAFFAAARQLDGLKKQCPVAGDSGFAFGLHVPDGRAIVKYRLEQLYTSKRTNTWRDLTNELALAAAPLDDLKRALQQPVLSQPIDYSRGFAAAPFTNFSIIRGSVRWLSWSTINDLHNGNLDAATDDITTIVSTTRLLKDDRLLISELVRMTIARIGLENTWQALQADGWNDAQLARLQQTWQTVGFSDALLCALEMERNMIALEFEKVRRENFSLDALVEMSGDQIMRQVMFAEFPSFCRLLAWRLAWTHLDEFHAFRKTQSALDKICIAASHQQQVSETNEQPDDYRLLFSRFVGDISFRVFQNVCRTETHREMMLAAIAIKRYQLRHGKLPSSLHALAPEFMPSLPHDWMDGKPLRYRVNTDGTFTLYSVGDDGVDNGGEPSGEQNMWRSRDAVWLQPATAEEVADALRKKGR